MNKLVTSYSIRHIIPIVIGLTVLVCLPLFLKSPYYLHILIMIFYFSYISCCWNILGGFVGQHSLGHSLFVGIGGYTSTLLFSKMNITPWVGMWIGALFAAAVGIVIGYLCFRYGIRGAYFLLATFAFAEVFLVLFSNIPLFGGAAGLDVPLVGTSLKQFQFSEKWPYYYISLVMIILVVALSFFLLKSRLGYYFVAIRESEISAISLGINVMKYKLVAVALSSGLCALGGTLYAQYTLYLEPSSALGLWLSAFMIIYSIVGGIGTILGPVLGAAVLILIGEIIRSLFREIFVGFQAFQGLNIVIYGFLLILVIRFLPGGIISLFQRKSAL